MAESETKTSNTIVNGSFGKAGATWTSTLSKNEVARYQLEVVLLCIVLGERNRDVAAASGISAEASHLSSVVAEADPDDDCCSALCGLSAPSGVAPVEATRRTSDVAELPIR